MDTVDRVRAVLRASQGLGRGWLDALAEVDEVPLVLYECDAEGHTVWVSSFWEHWTGGVPRAECMGLGWQRFIAPEELPATRAAWATGVRNGQFRWVMTLNGHGVLSHAWRLEGGKLVGLAVPLPRRSFVAMPHDGSHGPGQIGPAVVSGLRVVQV